MKFDRSKLYLPNDGDQGGGADGAGAGGGAGAQQNNQGENGGAGNDAGKPKRDALYQDLPDDHPLVKAYERVKTENKVLKPKAQQVDDAENAKKTDAEKIAGLQAQVDGLPKAVAGALREHLVALHKFDKDQAELFLTGDTPELMLRQASALLEQGGSGDKRKNYVKDEGKQNGKPAADDNASFAKSLFGGGDD
ncbi:scaffolding protein [Mycobacterium phage Cambiare]|uniref:Scaffolding protein n=2 Tax=Avocadovirus TaxID=2946813 RepID=A0A222YY39_9CAUD|nr:scaffolding protein [Mycobacterium phage Cambiare]YP_010051478.1 scaffolding protein [Mycobacterium phage Avocado]AKF14509.1 scaffolding protein [Mycobacterium phage Cambiare]ASR77208.1 scaffolding protein [Mycobacterium phage Avocado]